MWLFACAQPTSAPVGPTATTWAEEGQLVIDGLERAEDLWTSGERDAARIAAERVYTDRWEVRLEPAMRQMTPSDVILVEYAFGQLLVEMQGGSRENVASRIDDLERRVRTVAEEAAKAFPPPGSTVNAPEGPASAGIRPVTPDVKPNWER